MTFAPPTRHECRAEYRLRRKTPVNGRAEARPTPHHQRSSPSPPPPQRPCRSHKPRGRPPALSQFQFALPIGRRPPQTVALGRAIHGPFRRSRSSARHSCRVGRAHSTPLPSRPVHGPSPPALAMSARRWHVRRQRHRRQPGFAQRRGPGQHRQPRSNTVETRSAGQRRATNDEAAPFIASAGDIACCNRRSLTSTI